MTLPLLLLGISIISFMLLNFAPGDAAEITLRRQNGGVTPSRQAVAELRQELGLGDARAIEFVEVVWSGDGGTQRFAGLAMDRAYRLIEGGQASQRVVLRRFDFPPGD